MSLCVWECVVGIFGVYMVFMYVSLGLVFGCVFCFGGLLVLRCVNGMLRCKFGEVFGIV